MSDVIFGADCTMWLDDYKRFCGKPAIAFRTRASDGAIVDVVCARHRLGSDALIPPDAPRAERAEFWRARRFVEP